MTTAPVAVIAEPLLKPVRHGARAVRTTIWSLLVVGLVAIVSLQAFSLAYGVQHRLLDGLPETPSASAAVERIVLELQDAGLTCRAEPALTDRVVFQRRVGATAELLTFSEAVAAQKSGTGSIQRYCF